tara:strand:+ start:1640 stop:3070 length:1431 start_codon:yes stop_codon:yes gene_type:complete
MSKLFEEAIADAKKLKEVAEENAKKAILESVTPQIREFIEEQLLEDSESEEEDAEEVDELEEDVYLDEGALASLVELIGKENLDSLNESKSQKALFSAVKGAVSTMDDDQREKLLNLSHKLNESANHLSKTNKGEDMSKKYYEVDLRTLREALEEEEDYKMEEEEMTGEGEDAEELKELYEQFASLLEQDEEVEMEEPEMDMPELDAGAEGGADDMLSKEEVEAAIEGLVAELELNLGGAGAPEGDDLEMPELEAELPDLDAGGEEDLNETFEVDPRVLRQELGRIRKMVAEGKVDHHFGGKGGGAAGVDGAFGGKGNKNAGVKSAFGGGSEGQDAFTNPPQINKLNEAVRQLRRQNRAQKEKLNKYRGAVSSLREQLEDLNLFNAKLLYVNKLLQNKGLNESQKKSVIKALDEAQSLTEAKSLYKSLTETFSRGERKTISESRILGSSSRATTSSQSSATSTNNELGRWQRLAGL